jgi:tRNA G26 N,N-dimethylase Trm1
MWGGPLHNRQFIEKAKEIVDSMDDSIYVTKPRMKGFLHLAGEVRPHKPASTDQRNWMCRFIEHHRNWPVE